MGARAVVGTVVVVGLVVGGAVVADRVVHGQTEDRLAVELRDQIPGLEVEPDVTIEGFPFLTQVLAGELDDVRVTADEATVEGLLLQDIDVRLAGVSTDRPTTARTATMTAFAPLAGIGEQLEVPVDLTIEDGLLVAASEVFGMPLEVVLVPQAAGREIEVEIDAFRIAGATVSAEDLPATLTDSLDGLVIPIDGLPEGLELTDVTLEPEGFALVAEGTDVVLEADQLE